MEYAENTCKSCRNFVRFEVLKIKESYPKGTIYYMKDAHGKCPKCGVKIICTIDMEWYG
jgi:hypothetical protein